MTAAPSDVPWSLAQDQPQIPRQAKEAVLVFRDGSEVHLDELDERAAAAFRRLAGDLTRSEPD